MSTFNSKELTQILKNKIKNYETKIEGKGYGVVIEAGDGVATVLGLNDVSLYEKVTFLEKGIGMVMKIDSESVSIILFNEIEKVFQGCEVFATNQKFYTNVGDGLIGRVINALGEPLDDLGEIKFSETRVIDAPAPGITKRESVCEPLQTGITVIDSLIPIGLGQKQLILGDRKSGKTAIAVDAILNQGNVKAKGQKYAISIYVAIGKKNSEIAKLYDLFQKKGVMENTIIVAVNGFDSAAMKYIAPMVGATIAEYFRDQGKDALVVFDDLSQHADCYRQISLLMRRIPAREAYPGDIFYLHSRLLERAVKMKNGGSVTMLPIIETLEGDVSAYIPTNVISITDGQIYLDQEIFQKGLRPAINIGLSVSRIGSAAQHKNVKKITGSLKGELAQYYELEEFSKSVTDLDEGTKKNLRKGRLLVSLFNQKLRSPIAKDKMLVFLFAGMNNLIDDEIGLENFKEKIYHYIEKKDARFLKKLLKNSDFAKDDELCLQALIKDFTKDYKNGIFA